MLGAETSWNLLVLRSVLILMMEIESERQKSYLKKLFLYMTSKVWKNWMSKRIYQEVWIRATMLIIFMGSCSYCLNALCFSL